MGGLVIVKDNKVYTTSLILSEKVELEHRAILQLIRKYKEREIFKRSAFEMQKIKTKGRQGEVYFLTESQALFLLTLMKNSDLVVDFKENLVNEFFKCRKMLQDVLIQKQNAEYIDKRHASKQMRLQETDMIKKFVNYALDQGSTNAARYYANISKMETKALFFVEQKYPNMRDVMNLRQLNLIETADQAVMYALEEGMDANLPYKEIYIKAKERVEALARIFPKSPLPMLLSKQD